jgi:uracil-DNA glycosylase
MSSKLAFYAVVNGLQTGIFEDWGTTKHQVTGYPGAIFKRFSTRQEAESYMEAQMKMQVKESKPLSPSLLSMLTQEQTQVMNELLQGKNIALLGAAGCGKSYLLSVLYQEFPGLKRQYLQAYHPDTHPKITRIQICALTGCAALLLGHKAKTLHSWAGIGLGKGTSGELYTKIRRNAKAMKHWLCTDLLVIDEVSMMTADLLDKLNEVAKKIRSNKKPFGGMQVVLVGDFYQLPPVNKSDEATQFVFESEAWKEVIEQAGTIVELTEIQRQKDPIFQTILKEARVGALGSDSCKVLQECQERNWREHKIRPTLIFPRRAEVDMINESNLRALKGKRHTYKARLVYDGKMPEGFTEKDEGFQRALQYADSNASYLVDLELALNAQVMLIANAFPEQGLVNGSRGVIVEFCAQTNLPMVEFVNGVKKLIGAHTWPIEDYEFVSRSQIPLRLGYSITVHKCQGSTLDAALIDVGSGIFEYGQAYVALSRVRSLDALYVHDFDPAAFRVHPKVKRFYETLSVSNSSEDVLTTLLQKGEEEAEDTRDTKDTRPIIAEASKVIQAITVSKIESENELASMDEKQEQEQEPGAVCNWLYDSVPADWKSCLHSCEGKLQSLSQLLDQKEFLPSKDHVWTALALTPLQDIKVVILGQDPYPTPGNAHGLAFSVLPDVRPLPASLKNIYKELATDVPFIPPIHGNLTSWAKQGVLLLNTVLTVEPGAPQSHAKIGWEEVTDQIIRSIAAQTEQTIFVLWGKSAQAKKKLLDPYFQKNKHRVFESAHPSPLSAHKGFFGTRPFSTVNTWLIEAGKEPINWQL